MDLKETVCEDSDWIHLDQDRDQWRAIVNTVMKLRIPLKAGNLTSSATIRFSATQSLLIKCNSFPRSCNVNAHNPLGFNRCKLM
jgi:hypothetical protein